MTPRRVLLAERAALVAGLAAMAAALGAVDWRLGLFAGGAMLAASAVDWGRVR